MKRSFWDILKDIVIYSLMIGIIVFIGVFYFKDVSSDNILDKITQYVGALVTILLGVLGVIEFAYDNGLNILVPSSFENYKEKKLREQTKQYIREFFNNESEYFSQHSNARITFFLNQLGLNKNQFEQLKLEVLDIKLMPLHNMDDAKEKLRSIIQKGEVILSQNGKSTEELVYKEVDYFINFTDLMFVEDYHSQLTDCMVFLINDKCKANKIEFNRILVTNRGNFLLGTGVSQKMNVSMIKVTEKPLIFNSKSWIGNFSDNDTDKSIIVHDVLVSGGQIKESIEAVQGHTRIEAIFCLVNRLDYDGKKALEKEYNIPIYSLLDLDDDEVVKIANESM